jgi:hypothetical protein
MNENLKFILELLAFLVEGVIEIAANLFVLCLGVAALAVPVFLVARAFGVI